MTIYLIFTKYSSMHYNDLIISTMSSPFTSLTIHHSIVYSGADQRKHQSSASLAFVRGIHQRHQMETFSALLALCEGNSLVTSEFPSQRASNAENVSIWWYHHVIMTLPIQATEIPCNLAPFLIMYWWHDIQHIMHMFRSPSRGNFH